MAVLFPSEEWAKEFVDRINNDPEFAKAASTWEGSLALNIMSEDGLLDENFILWLDPYHGEVRDYKKISSLEDEKANFSISAKYSVWRDIVSGKVNPMMAMMTGKLRVKGNMAKLLTQKQASDKIMDLMQEMDLKFAG